MMVKKLLHFLILAHKLLRGDFCVAHQAIVFFSFAQFRDPVQKFPPQRVSALFRGTAAGHLEAVRQCSL